MWYLITLWLHGWCSFEWMKLKSGEGDKKDEKDRDDGTTTTKTTYTNFGEHTRAQRRFRFGSLHGTYSHLYSSIRKWYAITSHSYPHSLSSCVCMYIRVFYFIWYILSIRRLMLIQVNHHSRKREHNMANSSNVCNKWGVTWHGNEYFPRGGVQYVTAAVTKYCFCPVENVSEWHGMFVSYFRWAAINVLYEIFTHWLLEVFRRICWKYEWVLNRVICIAVWQLDGCLKLFEMVLSLESMKSCN